MPIFQDVDLMAQPSLAARKRPPPRRGLLHPRKHEISLLSEKKPIKNSKWTAEGTEWVKNISKSNSFRNHPDRNPQPLSAAFRRGRGRKPLRILSHSLWIGISSTRSLRPGSQRSRGMTVGEEAREGELYESLWRILSR